MERWQKLAGVIPVGEHRPHDPLSGGESFIGQHVIGPGTSGELSSGQSRLESLFLDESFGTPDSETLDAALNAETCGSLAEWGICTSMPVKSTKMLYWKLKILKIKY